MPVNRKQQVLVKQEVSEGTSSSPGASDAVQVFDPALSDSVDVQDRTPAGPSLSRDFAAVGRQTRQLTFRSDLRGSGDTSIPITEPEFGRLLKASGFRASTFKKLTLGAVTGTGFQVGEQVTQSSGTIIGVVVGIMQGGVPVHRTTTTGALLCVAVLAGTFTAAATTGSSSGSTSTASAVADYEGVCYQPTSQKLVNVTTAAWTGTAPAAVGEIMKVESPAGTQVGAVQIINNNGSFTDMDVTLLFGTMLNGYTLRAANGTGTTTINAAPTQVRTPSLTITHNLDGRLRELLGARGTFTLEGEVGQPMQFSWTFNGDIGASSDTPAVATTGLSTIRPPRLLGAFCCYGLGAETYRLPTKRVAVDLGATVNPNLDANRAGGATGSNVTDRDPAITATVDQVQGAFDWEAARSNGTPIRAAFILGTTPGNIMVIVAPICQVTEAPFGDADGIATFDVALKPRRVQESGDDELFIAQL